MRRCKFLALVRLCLTLCVLFVFPNCSGSDDPPEIAFDVSRQFRTMEGGPVLTITITEQGGGAGFAAVYLRDSSGRELPAGLYNIAELAQKKSRLKGKTSYDLIVGLVTEPGETAIGVSAFNRSLSRESPLLWQEIPPELATPADSASLAGADLVGAELGNADPAQRSPENRPALYALLGSGAAGSLEAILSRQETGALYSKVEITKVEEGGLSAESLGRIFDELFLSVKRNDVFVISFPGSALDNKNTKKKGVSPFELAGNLLKLKTRNTLLIIEDGAGESMAVLGERLGPRAILASQGSGGAGEPDSSAGRIARAIENGGKGRFLYASELIGLASLPLKDYPLFDRFLEPGELRISTLFPGTASVSAAEGAQSTATQGAQVAQIAALDSRFLDSLESAVFRLPEGRYAVTMTYRNSHRETRIAELANNGSADIAFTYRPTLRASDFRSPLPMFGVNIGELNPGNYRRADPAVLSQMGMEQHLISFLSGEKLYKAGDYDKAIAEYSRSINSKTDYADAYISRGNAYRKKGDLNRAIDDYTRALQYKNDLAEVYNYRAYAYAEKGEAGRAIDDYSRAIRIKKDYADAWYNRGYVYEEQGEYDKAIEDYNQVIRLEARNAAAYNRRGSAWYRKEDDDQAIRDYSEAVRLKPDYALAWRNRGNAWFSKGEFEKALADFNQALRIDPRSANAYISRGNLKKMMGDDEGAELDFAAAGRLR